MIPSNNLYRNDVNNVVLNVVLWIQGARNEPTIGLWYHPNNGNQVSTVNDSSPLNFVYMTGQIGLYHDFGFNKYEWIYYTCVILNKCKVNNTLMKAIYNLYT